MGKCKITITYLNHGIYDNSSFTVLSEKEVEILSTKKIKKFQIYIYDKKVSSKRANNFKNSVYQIMHY